MRERVFAVFEEGRYFFLNLAAGQMFSAKKNEKGRMKLHTYRAARPDPVHDELKAFVRAVRYGTDVLVDGEDGLAALVLADTIKETIDRASRHGRERKAVSRKAVSRKAVIVTGELSGELHAVHLVRAISDAVEMEFSGMGSTRLSDAGVNLVHDYRDISLTGLSEVFFKAGYIWKAYFARHTAPPSRLNPTF